MLERCNRIYLADDSEVMKCFEFEELQMTTEYDDITQDYFMKKFRQDNVNYASVHDDDEKDNSSNKILLTIDIIHLLTSFTYFVSIETLSNLKMNDFLSYFRRFLLAILHFLNATAYLLLPIGFVYTVSV